MKKALLEIISGFNSLLTGMRITLGQFFKPTVTLHYPHESLTMPARFRGHIELVRDPETGKAICFACKLCERACPSDCITVDGAKLDGAKKKSVTAYQLDFTKCSLCGACVEACRDQAIRFSRQYNLASVNKDEFVMDLFARLENEAKENPAPPLPAPAASSAPSPLSCATAASAPAASPSSPVPMAPTSTVPPASPAPAASTPAVAPSPKKESQ